MIIKKIIGKFVRAIKRFFNVKDKEPTPLFQVLVKEYDDISKKYIKTSSSSKMEKVAWLFWWDGFDNMPLLCKACFESVKKYLRNDFKIVFLDKNNYLSYVDLPDYIIRKHNYGIISHTHFSDILRVSLLCERGGLWMDASVYLTGSIPDYIYSSDLFVFKGSAFKNINCAIDGSNISSWFIFSNSEHPLLMSTRDMLYEYWKNNTNLAEYFLFHWFFTISARDNMKEWYKIPYCPNVLPHYLYFSIFDKEYDENLFKHAANISPIHKLSWHKEPVKNSFHDMIINNIL